ncbi:MAG: DNA methyltransferase [bacterium JZ-2024 1]
MESIQRFQDLLKKLFQFESSDLDFGIYRILNYKRDRIEKFIEKDLKDKVEAAFARHKDERLTNINEKFEKVKEKVIQSLGENAFTPAGDLKEEFRSTPIGKEFLSIKAQKEEVEKIDEIKNQVFNDLYNFFFRFYEEGDFVPQYRYSIKVHKYAIPYNGEEVKLYWANQEQYYTKTGLLFRDYTFKTGDYKVIFRIVSAKEELASNKATKERFFVLDDENPITFENKTIFIRFQYRELTEEEVKIYDVEGGSNTSKQEKINQKSYDKILKEIKDITLKAILSKEYKNETPLLLYQINRFTAKNSRDYFIHKNLKKFLSEQLDYFIKSEVLDIETLEKERFLDKHITRAKVVREIGEDIIDFLSQIEDFQKRLWEKKKFVIKTEYVITTDKVPEEFYDEIWKNEEQRKEWEDLGFEIPENKDELKNKKLPIDTKYFPEDFKEKLLEKLTEKQDLDDILDGLLIKSENWQALNLILNKYKEKVQTIYIDPPFNKEQDADYLYNVKYKDSTWASILENRLRLARDLLSDKGSIFVRCDYNGNWIVRPLMDEVFGKENFRNEIICMRVKKQTFEEPKAFTVDYDNLYFYSKNSQAKVILNVPKLEKIKVAEELWHSADTQGKYEPKVFFGKNLYPPTPRRGWFSQEKINELISKKELRLVCKKCNYTHYDGELGNNPCPKCGQDEWRVEYKIKREKFALIGNLWSDISGYTHGWNFQTENSEILLKRVIESTSNENDLVMDFFLGSGTTTAVAHKLKRKWIGIEMGEHFWTVVLPRMKKVLAYDKSGISKEKDVKEKYNEKAAGGFFKYQILEQYEDTLDNIELKENKQMEELFEDEYLIKYFLDSETKESPYLLNIEHLKNPFAYKLKVNLQEVGEPQEMVVDIPETFNYLLGIKVKKIKVRNNERKYLFILGEKESREIAIVWREYSDNWGEEDFKKDKEFIIKELENWKPHIVYINGQSVLTPKNWEVRYIEPEFKRLMET